MKFSVGVAHMKFSVSVTSQEKVASALAAGILPLSVALGCGTNTNGPSPPVAIDRQAAGGVAQGGGT